jgi:type IV pilus assembly protein PilM
VDVGCFALANVYEVNYPFEDEGCFVLVDIGAETMTINAIKGEMPIFTKESSLGGSQITKQIQSVWGVEYEEAENLKMGGTTDKPQLKELQNIFVSIIPTWSAEIKQVVDLLSTTRPNDAVRKILLSGGSSRIPGVAELIGKTTNIPVEIFNPFINIACDENNFDPKYVEYMAPQVATCVGLALREVGDK